MSQAVAVAVKRVRDPCRAQIKTVIGAEFARAALARWGIWLRQGGGGAAGFARETVEGRLRREGTLLRGVGGRPVLEDDPLSERIDRIVARLADDDRRWPYLLRIYYGAEDATLEKAADALASRYGERVQVRTVRSWLRLAEATVVGELRAQGLTGGAGRE